MKMTQQQPSTKGFAAPAIGNTLSILAGLAFYFLCMIMPLVGPAGSVVSYAHRNFMAFLAVLLITLALALLATWSKYERRKVEGGPHPRLMIALSAVCVLLLAALLTGLLKI